MTGVCSPLKKLTIYSLQVMGLPAASPLFSTAAILSIIAGIGVCCYNSRYFEAQKAYTRQLDSPLIPVLYLGVAAGACGAVHALLSIITLILMLKDIKRGAVFALAIAGIALSLAEIIPESCVVYLTRMGPIGLKHTFNVNLPFYMGTITDMFVPNVPPKSKMCDSSSKLGKWFDYFDSEWEQSFQGVSPITRVIYETVYGMFIAAAPSFLTSYCYTFNETWTVRDPRGSVIIDWARSTFPSSLSSIEECKRINIVVREYVGGWTESRTTSAFKEFCEYVIAQLNLGSDGDKDKLSDSYVADAKKAREDYTGGTYGLFVANALFVVFQSVALLCAVVGVILSCLKRREPDHETASWQVFSE